MKKLGLSVLVVLVIGTAPVVADLVAVGEATTSNSWYQAFSLTDTKIGGGEAANFDGLKIVMTAGFLEVPGLTNLSPSMTIESSDEGSVAATAENIDVLDFHLNFEGLITDVVAFELTTWDWKGGAYEASGWETATWNGSNWSIVDNSALLHAMAALSVSRSFRSRLLYCLVPSVSWWLVGSFAGLRESLVVGSHVNDNHAKHAGEVLRLGLHRHACILTAGGLSERSDPEASIPAHPMRS